MKNKKIPTVIGIIILAIATALGLILVQGKQIFRLSASEDSKPQDVRITNITGESFTVSWTTKKSTTSFVKWGDNPKSPGNTGQDELGITGYLHSTTVKNLTQTKTYYFKINTEDTNHDNNGSAWQVTTGETLELPAEAKSVSGTLLKVTGAPAGGTLVFLSVEGASPMSTTTSSNGSFVLPVSQLRTADLSSYFTFTGDTTIEIAAQSGPDGVASAQIKYASSDNVPPMVLGQVYDFQNLSLNTASDQEELALRANIEAPNEATDSGESGFALDDVKIATPAAKTVTLESIDNGETVNTAVPEFFGQAPAGTEITITLNSDTALSGKATTGSNGKWTWSPPEGLEEGSHKVTLSWKDANGIIKTITKNFVVAAAQGPAFVTTPSASTTPSATLPPQPISGIDLPTVMMFLTAFALLTFCGTAIYMAK